MLLLTCVACLICLFDLCSWVLWCGLDVGVALP